MLLRLLPLVAGLLPVISIHLSYLVAIQAQRVPACIPYLSGCTSISATGRYPPASYLFKSTMLPETVLLLMFWIFSALWLGAMQRSAGIKAGRHFSVIALGGGGALALVLYITFLGTQEPFYEFMRRFGIYLYFSLTVFAQLLLALRFRRLAESATLRKLACLQIWLAALPFPLGATNLLLKAVLEDADRAQNIIEWLVALLMQGFILLSFCTWRLTGFSSRYAVNQR